mgnify:CR=1 FL=1
MPPEIASENEPPLFTALQRADERAVAGEGAGGDVAVQLCFDDDGAFLQIVDGKGRPREIDHRATRGAMRDLLKAMALIQRRQQDLVGWDGKAERIYLHHHEHLLWPLRNCAALMAPVRLS